MKKVLMLVLALASASSLLSAEETLPGYRLEGVVMDQENPSASVAIINGELLRPGDPVGDYRVVRVEDEAVILSPSQGGAEVRLTVSAKSVEPVVATPEASAPPPGWVQRFQVWWHNTFSPPVLPPPGDSEKANLWERVAITDLYKIFLACNSYQEMKQKPAESFPQLVDAGLLPERYKEGLYGQYRFSLSPDGIQASPKDSQAGLRHFMLDEGSRLHVERDKPAGPQSAVYDGKSSL